MDERAARAWGWFLAALGAVGLVLLVLFLAGVGEEEGCDPADRLPISCQPGDGGGAFSQPEEGHPDPTEPRDGTLAVIGVLLMAVGGIGAVVAFRRASQLGAVGVGPQPFPAPSAFAGTPSPGAGPQAPVAGARAPGVGPQGSGPGSPAADAIAAGQLTNLGVASVAGVPIGVMLGRTGLVTTATDGTFQPAYWCVRDGQVQVSMVANGQPGPLALSVPAGEAEALLRQWAPNQELPPQRSPA
ncbi:MAG TPA: hypothetical protein VIL48_10525 [Acidimicrobiales bacterium]